MNSEIALNSQSNQYFPIVYANRGLRFAAAWINGFLFIICCVVPMMLNLDALVWCSAIIYFAVQIYFIHKYKRTLGKKLTNLLVVDYMTSQPLGTGRYILREFVEMIGGQFGLGLINAICAFINKERRTITDMLFSTIVISTISTK